MNTLILDFLNSYADNPNPQYAVMLKGKWGCGKTHLIKQWKKRFDETADTDEEITLKPIYISTYGMDSVNDIKTAIDRELNPFFYSKTGRFIKGILKLAGKVVFKTSVDFNDNSKEVSIRPRACFSPSYNKVKSQTKHVWLLTLL